MANHSSTLAWKSHGQRSLVGGYLWGRTESDTCSNYCTIALISHASKVMLKILQARLQQYMNFELPDDQAGFRKGRGTRDQIANIHWIIKKAREFQKNIYFCFTDYAKIFDCVSAKYIVENDLSERQKDYLSDWREGT